jgi:hypothetical protein
MQPTYDMHDSFPSCHSRTLLQYFKRARYDASYLWFHVAKQCIPTTKNLLLVYALARSRPYITKICPNPGGRSLRGSTPTFSLCNYPLAIAQWYNMTAGFCRLFWEENSFYTNEAVQTQTSISQAVSVLRRKKVGLQQNVALPMSPSGLTSNCVLNAR